jgi:hypothetical protein
MKVSSIKGQISQSIWKVSLKVGYRREPSVCEQGSEIVA